MAFCVHARSCLTFYDSMDCSQPSSSVHGIFQARVIDWVAISSLRGIFLTQGSNLHLLCLLNYRWIPYHWATRETRIHLQVIFKVVGKKSFWNNKLLFLCRQFCGLLFGGTNMWWFVLLGCHSHWWSLVRSEVHGPLGTWPHSRMWAVGKWAKFVYIDWYSSSLTILPELCLLSDPQGHSGQLYNYFLIHHNVIVEIIGWRGRWEGGSGWGIHVNPWLIHVNIWQNPLQYCKVISLQLIKINGKKKVQDKRSVLESSPNHLPAPCSPVCGNIVFLEISLWGWLC